MSAPLLQINGLRVGFRDRASNVLEQIDLQLESGQVLGLIGGSGAGKSLLARVVIGLLPAAAEIRGGELLWRGQPLNAAAAAGWRGRELAYVFQDAAASLHPLRRVGAQLREALRVHAPQLDRAAVEARIAAALLDVGMDQDKRWLNAYPHQLSGGQRQRLMLALTLLPEPSLLVADEPTSALDPVLAKRVCELLVTATRVRGMALLLISHDRPRVAEYCDRVLALEDGRLRTLDRHEAVPGHVTPARESAARPADICLAADTLTLSYQSGSCWPWSKKLPAQVDQVSLSLAAGQRLAVVGGSGSGKSTLARGLLGLMPARAGEVRWFGRLLSELKGSDLRRRRRRVQMVFQDPFRTLDPLQRVDQMMFEALDFAPLPLPRVERAAKALELLADVGLDVEAMGRYPSQFSGGQRQRLAIARALACNPDVLICDEATSALDHEVQTQILDLLDRLARQRGLALLFISHDLDAVQRLCHQLLVMAAGRVVEHGAVADLLAQPRSQSLRELLAARPKRLAALP